MSKTGKAMVAFHRAATLSVDCPVCHALAGRHCPTRRKRPIRETHQARVVAWEKSIAEAIRHAVNRPLFPTNKEQT